MASSFRTPLGFRATDPDETEGRLLYRQRADAEARRSLGLARTARLTALAHPPHQAASAAATNKTSSTKEAGEP